MQPRAIETRYKGYRFRSRLEARWAVFFDHLGLQWEYEPEGFELKSGRYLPDFHIGEYAPGMHTYGPWVEIKGVAPTPAEVSRLEELCEAGASYGLIIWGPPGNEEWYYIHKEGHVCEGSAATDCCVGNQLWEHLGLTGGSRVSRAAEAARGARFEHGESGARRGR